jgi:hypothetical protein
MLSRATVTSPIKSLLSSRFFPSERITVPLTRSPFFKVIWSAWALEKLQANKINRQRTFDFILIPLGLSRQFAAKRRDAKRRA